MDFIKILIAYFCSPHPGNLLRTTDGKLCILDWGMTLALPKDLQYALLEFIAHINSESYDDIPQDFINLGFSPPDKLERLKRSGLTDGFAFTLRQLSGGGGAKKTQERLKQSLLERYGDNLSDDELRKKAREEMMQQMEDQLKQEGVDVGGVSNMMEEISKRNKEIFQVPPYVLYTTRAFSTLEGIGLSVNEDYAIVQECYPYLAKRLMTDDSPRSRNALRNMLVKSTTGVLSPSKLIEMSEGFNSYTASTVSIDNTGAGMQQAQEEFIELLLSPKGNLIQDLVIEAAANVTDSLIRESLHRVKLSPGGQLVKSILKAPKNVVKAVVPSPFRMMLAPFTLPLTLPYDVAKAVVNIGSKSDSDRAAIESAEAFWNVAREQIVKRVRTFADEENVDLSFLGSSPQLLNPSVVRNALSDDRVRKRLPVLVSMSGRFGSSVLHRLADRVQHRNMSSIPVLKSTALPSEVGANNNSEISSLLQSIITSEEPDAIEALIDRVVSTATSESARRIAEVIDERVKSQMVIESPSASEQVLSAGFLASTSGLSKELPK